MSMAAVVGGPPDVEAIVRLARNQRTVVKTLSAVCRAEGLSASGLKAQLQDRIVNRIREYVSAGNYAALNKLKDILVHPDGVPTTSPRNATGYSYSTTPLGASPTPYGAAMGRNTVNGYHNSALYITFKPSPFYVIEQPIGSVKTLETNRQTVDIKLQAQDYPALSNMSGASDDSHRLMLFCANAATTQKQDIAFPHQSEIKVNGGEVKANLRGIKGKPGTTKPVDLTPYIRWKPGQYVNKIEVTYALTQNKFYVGLYLVKRATTEQLANRVKDGPKISKDSVLREMKAKANDPDIVATSTIMSLKCPLSAMRMTVPCRGTACRHVQCFDVSSYLMLQEQAPTWLCPICNNSAPFETLAVDEYVKDILAKTPKSLEQVTIEPDGNWTTKTEAESQPNGNTGFASDGDDDIIEIVDPKVNSLRKASTPATGTSATPTPAPAGPSSVASVTPIPARPANKRSIDAVTIDLTASDDDEEPIRGPPKRQQTSFSGPSGIDGLSPYAPNVSTNGAYYGNTYYGAGTR